MPAKRTALIIQPERGTRERLAEWLTEDGFDVLECPGPSGPDYTCMGGRGRPCPLAVPSDVVVLNMQLESDSVMRGTPAWELLLYYLRLGKKVLAVTGGDESLIPLPDDDIAVIPRTADRIEFLEAVHSVLIRANTKAG